MTELDYQVRLRSGTSVSIELKTKRQRYSAWWAAQTRGLIAADQLIIIDELTIRRLIDAVGIHEESHK